MDINCSNRVASPAYKGTSVWVTLDGPESLSVLPLVQEGQVVLCESSTDTGIVDRVDRYGHRFRIAPLQTDYIYGSTNASNHYLNCLNAGELLTITVE